MGACGPRFLGLDVDGFWRQMEVCYRPLLGAEPPPRDARPDPALAPVLTLEPAPESWPDPEDYLHEEG
jgi:hypothetical protein